MVNPPTKRLTATTLIAFSSIALFQLLPGAGWLPPIRQLIPALEGRGREEHIALTFDDGPDPETTPLLLQALSDHGVRATFFVLGKRLFLNKELGREIHRRGHELAVHGWNHTLAFTRTPAGMARELRWTSDLIRDLTGSRPCWYRPPHGAISVSSLWAAKRAGLRTVLWSASARDWVDGVDAEVIAARVLRLLNAGGTLLLHDSPVGGSRGASQNMLHALPAIITESHNRGLRLGPLAEHFDAPDRR